MEFNSDTEKTKVITSTDFKPPPKHLSIHDSKDTVLMDTLNGIAFVE